jgi:hypothetical protein
MLVSCPKNCNVCSNEVARLREQCREQGIKVDLGSEKDFWQFVLADYLVFQLGRTGNKEYLLRLLPYCPEKKRRSISTLRNYIMSRWPSPKVRNQIQDFADFVFPPSMPLEEIRQKDEIAAFLIANIRAGKAEAPVPEWFREDCMRKKYEMCLLGYALRVARADPVSAAVEKATKKVVRNYAAEIERLKEKLERVPKVVAEKASETAYYKALAEDAVARAEELERYFNGIISGLKEKISKLETELEFLKSGGGKTAPSSILSGKKVCVVGDPLRFDSYRDVLLEFGTESIAFLDGVEDKARVVEAVRSSDVVAIIMSYGKHSVAGVARDEARKLGIPVVPVLGCGAQSLKRAMISAFGEKKEAVG